MAQWPPELSRGKGPRRGRTGLWFGQQPEPGSAPTVNPGWEPRSNQAKLRQRWKERKETFPSSTAEHTNTPQALTDNPQEHSRGDTDELGLQVWSSTCKEGEASSSATQGEIFLSTRQNTGSAHPLPIPNGTPWLVPHRGCALHGWQRVLAGDTQCYPQSLPVTKEPQKVNDYLSPSLPSAPGSRSGSTFQKPPPWGCLGTGTPAGTPGCWWHP